MYVYYGVTDFTDCELIQNKRSKNLENEKLFSWNKKNRSFYIKSYNMAKRFLPFLKR